MQGSCLKKAEMQKALWCRLSGRYVTNHCVRVPLLLSFQDDMDFFGSCSNLEPPWTQQQLGPDPVSCYSLNSHPYTHEQQPLKCAHTSCLKYLLLTSEPLVISHNLNCIYMQTKALLRQNTRKHTHSHNTGISNFDMLKTINIYTECLWVVDKHLTLSTFSSFFNPDKSLQERLKYVENRDKGLCLKLFFNW